MFVLRRPMRSSFAADAVVFCGGAVDEDDADLALVDLAPGFDVAAVARRMRLFGPEGHRLAVAHHVAAVRETFEESGLFLGRDVSGRRLGPEDGERLQRARADLVSGARFADVLRGYGLVMSCEELTYVAHFITPVSEPRRYDTRFFVAPAPPHQVAAVHRDEATSGGWRDPADLLAEAGADLLRLMPPTRILCSELSRHRDVAAVVADLGSRPVGPVLFDIADLLANGIPDRIPLPEEGVPEADAS